MASLSLAGLYQQSRMKKGFPCKILLSLGTQTSYMLELVMVSLKLSSQKIWAHFARLLLLWFHN